MDELLSVLNKAQVFEEKIRVSDMNGAGELGAKLAIVFYLTFVLEPHFVLHLWNSNAPTEGFESRGGLHQGVGRNL